MLTTQIPADLLDFLGEQLPRQSKTATAAYLAECLAEDPTYDVVDSIRFESKHSGKHSFSFIYFNQRANGNIEVAYGTPRTDGDIQWTNPENLINRLRQSGYISTIDAQAYLSARLVTPVTPVTPVAPPHPVPIDPFDL